MPTTAVFLTSLLALPAAGFRGYDPTYKDTTHKAIPYKNQSLPNKSRV